MGGAGAIAVGDGCQSLYVRTQQFGERLTLGVTQLRKLRCHVRNRAVMLADLNSVADDSGRRCESRRGEGLGDTTCSFLQIGSAVARHRFDVGHDRVDTLARKRFDGCIATDLAQLPHGGTGKIVVGMAEAVAPDCRQLKVLGRSPAPTTANCSRRCHTRLTTGYQGFEVTSNAGSAQSETGADIRRCDGPFFEK